jgi:hypothetical protein
MVRRETILTRRRAARRPFRWARGVFALLSVIGLVGCGGGDDDETPPRKPDTGYGKGEPVPATPSCADLCSRIGDCAVALCDEDTKSTKYDPLLDDLIQACLGSCSESNLAAVTSAQWNCYFTDSCRQVFDYAACPGGGSYFCN